VAESGHKGRVVHPLRRNMSWV